MVTIGIKPEVERRRVNRIMLYHGYFDGKLKAYVVRNGQSVCDSARYENITSASGSRLARLSYHYETNFVVGYGFSIFIRARKVR